MKRPTSHLAVLKAEFIELILIGRKTVESRLTLTRREPMGVVKAGDVVYFKGVGRPVSVRARVRAVRMFENLTPAGVRRLKAEYNREVCAPGAYWAARSRARYATLIWLEAVEKVVKPWTPGPMHGRGWRVLERSPGAGGST